MRSTFAAMFLGLIALSLAGLSTQTAYGHPPKRCGCGASAPAPAPACGPVDSCNPCGTSGCIDACGCNTCGSLCSDWNAFYQVLYSEFYAKNAWYVEHRQREAAARRARMLGLDDPAPVPGPVNPQAKPAKPVKTR